MKDFSGAHEPSLLLGGVPMVAQGFTWSLIPGPYPYETTITVPKGALSDAVAALTNPTYIELRVWGGVEPNYKTDLFRIENIYIEKGDEIDDYHVAWRIADQRWALRGRKIYCSYNKTRVKNQVGFTVTSPPNDPASLRAYVDTYAIGRYLPWSVNSDGLPYTVAEILAMELKKQGIDAPEQSNFRMSYYVENVEYHGADVYSVIADLLAKSRLNLGIKLDGSLELYSLDFFDESEVYLLKTIVQTKKTSPGRLWRQDLKRVRPPFVSVLFEKKRETWVTASQSSETIGNNPLPVVPNSIWTQMDIDDRRAIGCENVVRVPYPLEYNGKRFQIGEYVPFWKFLAALGITETDVQTRWFGNTLEMYLAYIFTAQSGGVQLESNYNLAAQICGAIRGHYRRVYQIDPYHMDRIERWETRQVSVIDTYSRFTPPSPLYADYCIVPKVRTPSVAKRTASWTHLAYNWLVNTEDAKREKATAGTVRVVSQPLGVFEVSYPPDIFGAVAEIIPSAVNNLPSIVPGISAGWLSASLATLHNMDTVLSIVWAVDERDKFDSPKKYFRVSCDYNKYPATGPAIEFVSNLEYARYAVDRPSENITSGEPINKGILEGLAMMESAKIYNQYLDRVVGLVVFPGKYDFRLTGNCKAVSYSFTEGRGLETIIDLRDIPPTPRTEQRLSQSEINYIHRHVTKADERSQAAGGLQ